MSHENQKIELMGKLKALHDKDLNLNFQNVALDKILPSVENFAVNGRLNGQVNLNKSITYIILLHQ